MLGLVRNAPDATPDRPFEGIRTTRQRGRTSAAKERALQELGPRWALSGFESWDDESSAAIDRSGPVRLDIGVGNGEATRAWAADDSGSLVVAFEVYRPGLATLLLALDSHGPPNVRVAQVDALEVLPQLTPGSITALRVLFPDPWPKRRHVSRRLVDGSFASAAAAALAPGGTLHLATDWTDYAHQMRAAAATDPRLLPRPRAGDPACGAWRSDRPDRPVTAYERRGTAAGRTITDLLWERAEPS